jgi:hypothetical protein
MVQPGKHISPLHHAEPGLIPCTHDCSITPTPAAPAQLRTMLADCAQSSGPPNNLASPRRRATGHGHGVGPRRRRRARRCPICAAHRQGRCWRIAVRLMGGRQAALPRDEFGSTMPLATPGLHMRGPSHARRHMRVEDQAARKAATRGVVSRHIRRRAAVGRWPASWRNGVEDPSMVCAACYQPARAIVPRWWRAYRTRRQRRLQRQKNAFAATAWSCA